MTQITARITDTVTVGLKKIGAAIDDITNDELEQGLEEAATEARAGYPGGPYSGYTVKPPPGSRYKRTGQLGARTSWRREGRSFRLVSNAITRRGNSYSPYVLGNAEGRGQIAIHKRSGWPLLFAVAKKWISTIVDNTHNRLRRVIRQEGLGL